MNLREARQAIKAVMQAVEEPSPAGNATVKTIRYNNHQDVVRGEVVCFAEREWLDVSVYTWQVHVSGAYGHRTYYTWWLEKAVGQPIEWDAGTLVAYTVEGSHYYGKPFRVIADTHVVEVEGLKLS